MAASKTHDEMVKMTEEFNSFMVQKGAYSIGENGQVMTTNIDSLKMKGLLEEWQNRFKNDKKK